MELKRFIPQKCVTLCRASFLTCAGGSQDGSLGDEEQLAFP